MGVAGRGDILGGRGGVGGPRRKRDSRRHQEGDTFTSFDTLLHTHTHTHTCSHADARLTHTRSFLKLPALKTYVQCPSVSTGILFVEESERIQKKKVCVRAFECVCV